MQSTKLYQFIMICTNDFGVCSRLFQANKRPRVDDWKPIAVALGIWMEGDKCEVQEALNNNEVFILE